MAAIALRVFTTVLIAASVVSGCVPTGHVATETCPQVEFGVFHQQQLNNSRSVRGPDGRVIYFEQTPITRLQDISQARLGNDEATVLMTFTPDAAKRLRSSTTGHSGVRLALVVDDQAPMAVVWEGDYGIEDGRMQFSFRSKDTARELVRVIGRCTNESNG